MSSQNDIDEEIRQLEERLEKLKKIKNENEPSINVEKQNEVSSESVVPKRKRTLDDSPLSKKPRTDSTVDHQPKNFSTYNKRPGTIDQGKEYECLMCAFYALRFSTSNDVLDFAMSTNHEECGDFDDIKLEVTFKTGKKRLYLFQLKHKEKEKPITWKDLVTIEKVNNAFSLHKYLNSLLKIYKRDTICVLYTNSPTTIRNNMELLVYDNSLIVKECHNLEYKNLLMNAKNTSNSAFQFIFNRFNYYYLQDWDQAFRQFYFFTNQNNVHTVKSNVKDMLKHLLHCDIYQSFIHFIQYWWSQNFVLTKYDIISKLVELALSPYIRTISGEKHNEKSKYLTKALMDFELTIVKNLEDRNIENIWEAADKDYCDVNLGLQKFGLSASDDPLVMQKTKILWHADMVPLIVNIDSVSETTVKCALQLLKKNTKMKKMVLLGNVTKGEFQQFCVFENLADLIKRSKNKKLCSTILQNFHISLQGRPHCSLECLIELDQEFIPLIETRDLIRISQQDFLIIGCNKQSLPEPYIPRTISPIFIDTVKTLNHFGDTKECIIIINCDNTFKNILLSKDIAVMETALYLNNRDPIRSGNLILLSIGTKCTYQEFQKICEVSGKHSVYVLQVFNKKCCIVLFRKGNELPLDLLRCGESSLEETEILKIFNKSVNVVCASSGLGKSSLLKFLNNCPSECWCIYVNLIKHNAFFEKKTDCEQLLNYFMQFEIVNQDPFVYNIFKVFLKNEKVNIFLDGLDEVHCQNIDFVLDFVKRVSSKGTVWISSRNHLRERILECLKTEPLEIEEIAENNQKKYLYNKLQKKYSVNELDKIITTIYDSLEVTKSQKLLKFPLHLYIISEALETNKKNVFTLTKICELLLEGKKKFALQKIGVDQQERQLGFNFKEFLKNYEIPALKACLNTLDFAKLNLDLEEMNEYIETVRSEGDKFGIIRKVSEKSQAIFEHQVFAEYFACLWLKRHLRDALFLDSYQKLKAILDIMLEE